MHRKSDDGVRGALDVGNQQASDTLDRICSSLVHGFTGSNVPPDHFVGEIYELHPCSVDHFVSRTVGDEREGGVDQVRPPRQTLQHARRAVRRRRFAENLPIDLDHGVCSENQPPRRPGGDR